MPIMLKRAYEGVEEKDGVRVLVDGMWPRGISKEGAKIDHWMKQIAPSKELRQWFNHDASKFDSFKEKYKQELKSDPDKQDELQNLKNVVKEKDKKVTLIYAAKDEKHNQAQVLKEILDQQPTN